MHNTKMEYLYKIYAALCDEHYDIIRKKLHVLYLQLNDNKIGIDEAAKQFKEIIKLKREIATANGDLT